MVRSTRNAALVVWCLLAVGCGATVAAENADRSLKQYQLSVALVGEKNVAGAFEHLFKAIDLDPKNVEAQLLLGNLYMFRGDFQDAERHMRIALKIAEQEEKYGPPMVADIQNALGVVLVHQGRTEEAIEVLRSSAENLLNRHSHLSWGNLGWAYYETEQYKDALTALTQSVRREPGFCLGFFRLGLTYAALHDYENSEAALTNAVESTNDACKGLQEAWLRRGEARAQLGFRDDAITDFEHCIQLGAENETGRTCQGYLEATH